VTSVTDAGYRNDFSRLELYRRLHAEGRFKPRTTVMMAPDAELAGVPGDGWVRPGAVKLMLSCSGGRLSPPPEELFETARAAMAGGAGSLAIHAVEETAVLAACEALASCAPGVGITRIEHASQSPPAAVDAIARSGAAVVTQPGLIWRRGERYVEAARSGAPSLSDLYPLRSLIDAGVLVAGSTDAPYGSWHPLEGIATAMTRTSRGGQVIGSEEAVRVEEALELFGPSAAAVEGIGRSRGSLQVGKVADFVVLDVDPLESDPAGLMGATVLRTVIAGATVWAATAA
jgi:predicted amidohydrolase YtcJ